MSAWRPRRFWKAAEVRPEGAGWAVTLDGRPVRTPGKQPLLVPTEAMARAVAAEWDAQEREVRPETMPMTRMANSAIEKVAPQHAAVVAHVAAYGGSDLVCYRAERPAGLVARQAGAWDPLLDWMAGLGAPLAVTAGVIHVAQPAATLRRIEELVGAFDAFRLTAFHDLVGLSGSLVLGLAVAQGRLPPAEAWDASRIDEDWQIAEWGEDAEAAEAAAARRAGFLDAARFFAACG